MSDDLRGRALRGIAWVAIEKWGVRLVSLGVFAILTRTVAPESFGLLSLTTVFVALLMVFVDAGFAKSLIQKRELDEDDASTAFWTSVLIAIIIYVGLWFCAPLLASVYQEPELTAVLRVMGAGLLVNSLCSVPAALLERDLKFRSLSLRSLVGTVAGAVIAVPLALSGAGVWALVAQSLGTLTASGVALWVASGWHPSFRYSLRAFRRMLSFGLSVLGLELMNALQANVDKLLIGSFLGTGPLGIYYIAQRILNIVTELLTTVIGKLALTTFSRLQADRERLVRGFLQMTFASGMVAVPAFGIIATLGDIILPYLFGAMTASSVPIMQVLAVSACFAAIVYVDKNVLLAVGKPRQAFTLGLVENIVGIALLLLALPFGLLAVAIARAARLFVVWPYRLWLLKRWISLPLKQYLFNIGVMLLAILPAGGIALGLSISPWRTTDPAFWLYAVPVGFIMLITYYGMLWLCCGPTNRSVIRRTLASVRGR